MELREYQRDCISAVWAHLRTRRDNPVIVLPTGCGKAVVIAEMCRQAVSNWGGRVLILTHVRELIQQGAEKIRMFLPTATVGVHSAGLNKRDLNHPVICGGIQSLYRRACDLGAFNLIVIDECFPAGTMIDTPRGEIPIEDLYVGQPVRHALGVGNIEAISTRPAGEIIKLELSNGKTIECTPNHRFFTDAGWRAASALAVGTRLFSKEDVSHLRKAVFPEWVEGRERGAGSLPSGSGMEDQNLLFPGIRVVGIVHVKLESPRVVYNLQVAEHPSYYADGVLVHNCHLIPSEGEGMYRTFLKDARIINPSVRLCGLTATPFRLSSGSICSKDGLLNEICYEAGVKEMIDAGWLSPLISQSGRQKADVSGLHVRGGEFIPGEIEQLMDADALVRSAVAEIVEATRDRKSCLIFCAGVKHGEHVVRMFREDHGLECGFVEGNTPMAERARLVARFKGEMTDPGLFDKPEGRLKYLVNVAVLGTGFDAPQTDCVVLLRPTMSPGLFIQQVGRGFRLAEGKQNCLILDFAGNLVRHGPVDLLKAGDRPGPKGEGEAPAKECPDCHRVCHASIRLCPNCGYEFPKPDKPKHHARAATAPVISVPVEEETPQDFEVADVVYSEHLKRNAPPGHPPSLRVGYQPKGYTTYISEWVCPQHSGYAREKFLDWWKKRSHFPPPKTVNEAIRLARSGALAPTLGIRVKSDANGYERIVAWSLGEKPDFDSDAVFAAKDAEGDCAAGDPGDVFDTNYDDIPF